MAALASLRLAAVWLETWTGGTRSAVDTVDELKSGSSKMCALVAVEARVARLVSIAGLGIDRGDDPVPGHATHDTEYAVILPVPVAVSWPATTAASSAAPRPAGLHSIDHRQGGEGHRLPRVGKGLAATGSSQSGGHPVMA